ncbi:probable membrane-associated kinase regulator 5 [Hibiscus syriacus]|uniref:probable membrane-associated kinase regulator 5 n=1 Tax=Hibiscus syriacus TaxID=106335 RepID=UPI001923B476|nr:probable membrane-associated kinase regulator 5 [Hibiscus syriacus]
MEALNFTSFWKPSNGGYRDNRVQPRRGNISTTEVPKAVIASDHELDEGDDSFFDLELRLHGVNGEKRFESKEDQTRTLSTGDNFSKRKIIPIEASSKPQSPMASLKSTPKFRVFTLRKSKSVANTSTTYMPDKAGLIGLPTEPTTSDDSSKRLLKGLMQKYLNKLKPLYVKASRKNGPNDKIKVSIDLSVSSPVSSPASVFSAKEKQAGVCKQLGKCRSTSAAFSSPVSRRDDSLLLQHDGIQSAILHCKRSLNSSRESSRLSRCTSDSSQEKLSNASSTDSSLLSRATCNSLYEKLMDSARISGN